MKRDASIEFYRILLTYGIVVLHVIGFYGAGTIRLSNMFVWCVPGFVFITGYFGCRFNFGKPLKLYGVALYCFPITVFMGKLVGGGGRFSYMCEVWQSFCGNWFIHAYIGMLMIIPLVDAALEQCKQTRRWQEAVLVAGPFLFFVFGWSFLSNFNCCKSYIPQAPTSAMLTLVGIYAFARIFQFCQWEDRIGNRTAFLLLIVCALLSLLKIGQFNSIVSLGITVGSFVLCHRLSLPNWMMRFVLFSAPSMFSIFLLHAVPWCLNSFHAWVDVLVAHRIPLYLSFFLLATFVFCVGLILDLPRRAILRYWHALRK